MKRVTRFISILLVLAMVFSFSMVPALAADGPQLGLTVEKGTDGKFTATVSAAQAITFATLRLTLTEYDKSSFELIDAEAAAISGTNSGVAEDYTYVSLISGKGVTVDSGAELAVFTFTTASKLADGAYSFAVTATVAADKDAKTIAGLKGEVASDKHLVGKITAAMPVITTSPEGATYKQNTDPSEVAALTVEAEQGETSVSVLAGELSYQWYSATNEKNATEHKGSAISGADKASYTPLVTSVGTTYYYAAVTNALESGEKATAYSVAAEIEVEQAYAIKFDANNGTGNVPVNNADVTASSTEVSIPANALTRTGYTPSGWALDANAAEDAAYANAAAVLEAAQENASKYIKNNTITLYAVWAKGSYDVTAEIKQLNASNEPEALVGTAPTVKVNSVSAETAEYGATVTVEPVEVAGYTLIDVSYSSTPNSEAVQKSITAVKDVYSFTMPAYAVTVTATYQKEAYTIEYYSGDAFKSNELYSSLTQTVAKSKGTVNAPAAQTKDGQVFAGWTINGTDVVLAGGELTLSAPASGDTIKVYAKWDTPNAEDAEAILDALDSVDVEVPEEAESADPEVTITGVPAVLVADAQEAASAIKITDESVTDVDTTNLTDDIDKDSAIQALIDAGLLKVKQDADGNYLGSDGSLLGPSDAPVIVGADGETGIDDVNISVEVYMEVNVTGYTKSEQGNSFNVNIEPKARVSVSTAAVADESNTVLMKEGEDVELTDPVDVTVPLPNGFMEDAEDFNITHETGVNAVQLTAKESGDDTEGDYLVADDFASVTLTTKDFSPFAFTTTIVAKNADGKEYGTLQAAVNENLGKTVVIPEDVAADADLTAALKNNKKVTIEDQRADTESNPVTIMNEKGTKEITSATGTYAGDSTGGGGGGGAAANVTVTSATNGTVKVSNTAAKAGEKVTVTLTPSTGYEADTLTVKDKSGATVEATKNADGTYTFTMPAASKLPVSVSATFKKAAETTGFIDVAADAYYADAVKWAVNHDPQITNGKDAANTFKPNDVCTRAEAVTFLYRAAGAPDVAVTNQFKDVASDAWYAKAVAWAVANGITNGKDAVDTFKPTDTCSRAEIVTFLARLAKAANTAASTQFKDVAADDYFAGSVAWAVNNGITNGKNAADTFLPKDGCTRAEIVTFLYRDFVK